MSLLFSAYATSHCSKPKPFCNRAVRYKTSSFRELQNEVGRAFFLIPVAPGRHNASAHGRTCLDMSTVVLNRTCELSFCRTAVHSAQQATSNKKAHSATSPQYYRSSIGVAACESYRSVYASFSLVSAREQVPQSTRSLRSLPHNPRQSHGTHTPLLENIKCESLPWDLD